MDETVGKLREVQENGRRRMGVADQAATPAIPPEAQGQKEVPCRVCGRPILVEVDPAAFGLRLACEGCIEAEEACRREDERQRADTARRAALDAVRADVPGALERVGVPAHWRAASFELCRDLPDWIIAAARKWTELPSGIMYLTGTTGTGKTTLAVAMVRHILEQGILPLRAIRFVAERQYLDGLKAGFRSDARPVSPRILPPNDPARVPMLVYDDLASTRLTPWAAGEVCNLIEARHANGLALLLTSNFSPDELAEALDPRVVSRISESRLMIQFPPSDLRKKGSVRLTSLKAPSLSQQQRRPEAERACANVGSPHTPEGRAMLR